jgi:hypothetical protein
MGTVVYQADIPKEKPILISVPACMRNSATSGLRKRSERRMVSPTTCL